MPLGKMRRLPETEDDLNETLAERIRSRLTPEMSVLELGCGMGRLTLPLCGGVTLWEATDSDAERIERMKRLPLSEHVHFSVQDAQTLPYEHSTFDTAVITTGLHVLPKPELALRELRRVLKPRGLLFAPTYLFGGIRTKLLQKTLKTDGRRVLHKWNAEELMTIVRDAGFTVEKCVILPESAVPVCYLEAVSNK